MSYLFDKKAVLLDDVVGASGESDPFQFEMKPDPSKAVITVTNIGGTANVFFDAIQYGETVWQGLDTGVVSEADPIVFDMTNPGFYAVRVRYTLNSGTLRAVLS